MFYSFRARLFAISAGLLGIFMLGIGVYLHEAIRGWTEERLGQDLEARAQLLVETLEADNDVGAAELVGRLEATDDQRVTLIGEDGRVWADTHLDGSELEEADNHADRPEIQTALGGETGLATRHSESVDIDMLYVAVPLVESPGVLRMSVPLEEVDDALARLRVVLVVGGLIGIGVAIFMSSVASRMASRVFQRVLDRTRRRKRRVDPPEDLSVPDEIDGASPAELAERLEQTLDLLVSERNRFRAVLDGMNEGVVATDEDLEITLSNRTAQQLLDTGGSLEGAGVDEVLPPEVIEPMVDRETDSVEFETEGPPTQQIHVQATPRSDSEGWILVLHDVTTIRQLETMRRDFVANVSHELKTPVTVIRANAETLLDGAIEEPEHARSFTEGIERNARRLSELIADLLDLSRIESGETDLEVEPVELADVAREVFEDVRRRFEDVPGFESSIDPSTRVIADPDALRRVVSNLVENAVKYGEGARPVELTAELRDDVVVCEIRDDGPGLAEEHRDRIFERFYRVDDGRSSDRGGTGLGLSIVKHLVDQMGGEVGYRVDDGSVFWFSLPAADEPDGGSGSS